MKLNPDCLRDILIAIEENTSYKVKVYYPSEKMEDLTKKYSDMQIRYHIVQASKANLIEPIYIDDYEKIYIDDLTPKGHEFLANIRSDTVWNKTKDVLSDIGTTSVTAIVQISCQVISALIKSKLGL